jgi:PAS domain-containing protein
VASLERHLIEAQAIAQLGSWEWEIESDRVIWSPELYAIYDLDPESAIEGYEAFLDRVHPEDRHQVDQAIRDAYVARASFAFEHRTRPVHGETRVLRARGRIVCDDDGLPRRMVGTAQVVSV